MFRCQVTKKMSRSGEKCTKIVVKTRSRTYVNQTSEGSFESHGEEIVKEIDATERGVLAWNEMTDSERASFVKRVCG